MQRSEVCIPTKDDYAVQSHQISRAAYTMPVMARRLIYLAMAQTRPDDEGFMDVPMAVGDVVRALELDDGAKSYQAIRDAARTCAKWILEIEHPRGGWELFGWLSYARYETDGDRVVLRLNDALRPYILGLQRAYASLAIADIARIQGRHALRWYELVMTREGQADAQGHWWYEVTIDELRHLLGVGVNEYRRTDSLRRNLIDLAITEINAAGLGLHLKAEYVRKGRVLSGVRVHAQRVRRGDPRPVDPPTPEEAADDALIARHQERYDAILADVRSQQPLPGMDWISPEMRDMAHRAEALTRLKAELPKRGKGQKT